MRTREQVKAAIKAGQAPERGANSFLDARDYARLADFFPVEEWSILDIKLKEGAEPPVPEEWTEENVKAALGRDLAFAFEKALNKRGISASLMYEVIKMWCWVLGADDIAECKNYAQYGLPVLKAAAGRFGLPNPIGADRGNEEKYSADG